jgi:hypothetical protein
MVMVIRCSTWIALFQRVQGTPGAPRYPFPITRSGYHAKITEREAPRLFAQALSRELDSPSLIAALRTLIGDNKAAEPIDILFQAQCDQLRQFCEQTGGEG